MWKKEDDPTGAQGAETVRAAAVGRTPDRAASSRSGFATIGPSIVIRGEVTGDEDLLIQGQIDGSVALGLHSVTVGDGGRVKAGITGRVITVEGSVEGDLSAEEQIVLRGTARVKGDLNAPRVVLEDGASFRGLVDMGSPDAPEPSARTSGKDSPDAKTAGEPGAAKGSANESPATGASARRDKEDGGEKGAPEARPGKPATG